MKLSILALTLTLISCSTGPKKDVVRKEMRFINSAVSHIKNYDLTRARVTLDSIADNTVLVIKANKRILYAKKPKDSLKRVIEFRKKLMDRVCGTYKSSSGKKVDDNGVVRDVPVVTIKLLPPETNGGFRSTLRANLRGQPINGLRSDGTFKILDDLGKIKIDWDVDELDKTMSDITISGDDQSTVLKLSNGTIFKKGNGKASRTRKSSGQSKNVKVVCGSTYSSLRELDKLLTAITVSWEDYVQKEIRSQYKESIDDADPTGASSSGILIVATGNLTGYKYKVLWTCDGQIVILNPY
jgi:hypothetical protein